MNFDRKIIEICAGKPNVLEKMTRKEIFQMLKQIGLHNDELLDKILEIIPPARLTINQWLDFNKQKCIYKKITAKTYTCKIEENDMPELLSLIYLFFVSRRNGGDWTPEYNLIENRYNSLLHRHLCHQPSWTKYEHPFSDPQVDNILQKQLVSKTLTYDQLSDEQFYSLPIIRLKILIPFMSDNMFPILKTYPDFIKEFNRLIYIIKSVDNSPFSNRLHLIIQMLTINNITHSIKNKIEILNKLCEIKYLTPTDNFLDIIPFDNLRNIESFNIEIYEPVYRLLTRKNKVLKKALDSTHLTIKKA